MIPGDPNVQRVELVAAALGELRHQLVLVGGCHTICRQGSLQTTICPNQRLQYRDDH